MTEDEVNELQGKGKKLLEETLGTEMETLHRDLLYIKMDQGNSMTSTTQGFDSTADGSYEDIRKAELSAIEEVYVKKGIKYQVIYGIREIDGLEFSTMEVLIYAGESRKVIFGQIFYDRLIDGKMILMLNINYTNEVAKRMLLQTIDSSKFSIRD